MERDENGNFPFDFYYEKMEILGDEIADLSSDLDNDPFHTILDEKLLGDLVKLLVKVYEAFDNGEEKLYFSK